MTMNPMMATSNRGNAALSEAVQRRGPIFERISELVCTINDLEKALDALTSNLGPVLVERCSPKDQPPEQKDGGMCEIEHTLDAETKRIRRLIQHVGNIGESLRL